MRLTHLFVALAALVAVIAPSTAPAAQLGTSLEIPEVILQRTGSGGGATFIQPYDLHYIVGGIDSRTALGGGLTGTYGVSTTGVVDTQANGTGTTVDGLLSQYTNNRLSAGSIRNQGIGGSTAAVGLAYPRSVFANGLGPFTASIASGTLTVPSQSLSAGDAFDVGQLVTCTGCTSFHITGILTGTGGVGTYSTDNAQTVAQNSTFNSFYVYGTGKTIADVAANPASIVTLWGGTNDEGSANELTAMTAAVRGLTDPTYSYPGYGGPLPLYNGLPKTVLLFNETRKGVTALNASHAVSTAPAQFNTYAGKASSPTGLFAFSYDSGVVGKANPHVIVADTFNDPVMSDLTDTTNYLPKGGWWADGLHPAGTAIDEMDQVMAARINALIPKVVDYNPLLDTTTASTNSVYTVNPLFVTQSGGTEACANITKTYSGGAGPASGWKYSCTGGGPTGVTLDVTYTNLGGTLGWQANLHFTATSASANFIFQWQNLANSTQLSHWDNAVTQARSTCMIGLTIASGSITAVDLTGQVFATGTSTSVNQYTTNTGYKGSPAGYTNNALYPMLINNPYASVNWTTPRPWVTKNFSVAKYGATGNATKVMTQVEIGFLAGALDATLTLSQCGAVAVTN